MAEPNSGGTAPAAPTGSAGNSGQPEGEQKRFKSARDWLLSVVPLLPVLVIIGGAYWAGIGQGEKKCDVLESCLKDKQTFLEAQVTAAKEKTTQVERKLAQDEQELALVKNDLSVCKSSSQEAAGAAAHPPIANAGEAEIQVLTGETARLFKGQLFVSVTAVQPSPTPPPHYQAFAILGAPGQKSEEFHGDAGQAKTFAGFEARITQVNAASATFHVRKLSQSPTSP
jgi:hypothetical protein